MKLETNWRHIYILGTQAIMNRFLILITTKPNVAFSVFSKQHKSHLTSFLLLIKELHLRISRQMIIMRVDHENISNTKKEDMNFFIITCVFLTRFPNFYNYKECVWKTLAASKLSVKFPGSSKVHFILALQQCNLEHLHFSRLVWPIISDL